jgi:D-tyrosyl-tRNA(Tyr) deacylase
MKAVIQRVKKAKVIVKQKTVSQIDSGFLVFLGVAQDDTEEKLNWLVKKVAQLRIMSDEQGKMNRSLADVGGQVLVVSQFTLYGDCRKGNRPSFVQAAKPKKAERFYHLFIKGLESFGLRVKAGVFREMMGVELINDGPVTIIISN